MQDCTSFMDYVLKTLLCKADLQNKVNKTKINKKTGSVLNLYLQTSFKIKVGFHLPSQHSPKEKDTQRLTFIYCTSLYERKFT